MEQYIQTQILAALAEKDIAKFVAYVLIFVGIWLEVRSLKKVVQSVNETVKHGFEAGEKRFSVLEKTDVDHEHRLTVLETKGSLST